MSTTTVVSPKVPGLLRPWMRVEWHQQDAVITQVSDGFVRLQTIDVRSPSDEADPDDHTVERFLRVPLDNPINRVCAAWTIVASGWSWSTASRRQRIVVRLAETGQPMTDTQVAVLAGMAEAAGSSARSGAPNMAVAVAGVGRNITRLRQLRGMSQRELAGQIGVNQSTMSHTERGLSAPSTERLERLAAALGVSPAALTEPPQDDGVATRLDLEERITALEARIDALRTMAEDLFDGMPVSIEDALVGLHDQAMALAEGSASPPAGARHG